jgi:EAL domain-containing protein (putative c-di-GMP-specific phosphodiesterase class I)/GGDEF domain-containing protein
MRWRFVLSNNKKLFELNDYRFSNEPGVSGHFWNNQLQSRSKRSAMLTIRNAGENEAERMRALRDLNLLDTPPSESFDRITRMACQVFNTPIAAVSLTDQNRQWFKSRVGCGPEIPRDKAPCAEVTRTKAVLVVPDMAQDPRFSGGVLVDHGVRFYAGAPLNTRNGFTLGSMCVLDTEPRNVTQDEEMLLNDLAAMVMAQIELQHALGRLDPTSGLPNRSQFAEDLDDLNLDHPGEERIAVLIDLADSAHLAQAMRVLGPSYLDDLIKLSTDIVQTLLDQGVALYHVGSTQFTAVLGAGEESIRSRITTRLAELRDSVRGPSVSALSGVAVGIAQFRVGEAVAGDILRSAHAAAQDARESGLSVGLYSPATDAAHKRRYALVEGLREALLAPEQLSLVFQPCIDLKTGRCESGEALLRWHHPVLGSVPPGEFIPLAEQTELIHPVTDWVVDAVVAQVAGWRKAGANLRISVNVAAAVLEQEGFAKGLAEALHRHALPASSLEIEFTESALIMNRKRVLDNLMQVSRLGILCAIDDFGTGYSSFSYLQDIPTDILKIDQSFIRPLVPGSRGGALVRHMINMAHELGYRVVAEGVETRDVYDFLKSATCDEVQGYLISRPIPAEEFLQWFRDRRTAAELDAA